ncbi:hypothetical protein TPHA_0E02040 [Tetrapisispora phaffii CBS 4417]|uniref:E3 SUMO-protein transferase SIZ2 n=1 Tax=Tetrapisispora phaffii (strain ATCC 24235 / CBS 4417 / NBRC 1672 / NRRL Y-8282 / UCD 70-5) TaxID=1071381 RepID=G8BTR8_TETPH|nr:hypothetical protein TPHA_0E02040 [Tetrapisispora phaffii CBS 4417]CCE63296.1 hypothetical protein TPHA_0E02040 [Tetrapisispora phaffii CBS 4417]
MSTGGGGLQGEMNQVLDMLEDLRVYELKFVCKAAKLPVTGRKALLQDRIKVFLKKSLTMGHIDPWRPKTIKELIKQAQNGVIDPPDYEVLWTAIKTGRLTDRNQPASVSRVPAITHNNPQTVNSTNTHHAKVNKYTKQTIILHFKESPFYKVLKLIPHSVGLIKKTTGRGVCTTSFRFTDSEWRLLQSDKEKYKLYLFSGILNASGQRSNEPIQFPHPNEIKFNNIQIKDNVIGLKSKPGTGKPANLTPYTYPPSQVNVLEIVHAFTANEYSVYCYIVENVTPEELLQNIIKNPKILRTATLQYIKKTLNDEEDDDLITTSTVMSLQCPISYTRMKYPAKGINCQHLQCFDALWYFHSQKQLPTWQCPVCQLPLKVGTMAICEFVEEILRSTGDDIEQIELAVDGSWVPLNEDGEKVPSAGKLETKPVNHMSNNLAIKKEDSTLAIPKQDQINNSSTIPHGHSEQVIISLDSEEEDDIALAHHVDEENNEITATQVQPPNNHALNSINSSREPILQLSREESNGNNNQNNGSNSNELSTTSSTVLPTTNIDQLSQRNALSTTESGQNGTSILGIGTLNDVDIMSVSLGTPNGESPHNNANENPQNYTENRTAEMNTNLWIDHPTGNNTQMLSLSNGSNNSNILGISGNSEQLFEPINQGPENSDASPELGNVTGTVTDAQNECSGQSKGYLGNTAVPGRHKSSNVSPFIPKKPYLNRLPQKRQMHNNSGVTLSEGAPRIARTTIPNNHMHNNIPNSNPAFNLNNNISSTPTNPVESSRMDIIDLTSD